MLNDHFRQALIDCDVELCRKIWAHSHPHLPQPESDDDVLTTIHIARTGAESIAFKHRAYSHAWLRERNLPSKLPDELKPRAERLYPVIIEGVGIAVKSSNKKLAFEIRTAMERVVLDCYANGDRDPALIRRLTQAARWKVKRQF